MAGITFGMGYLPEYAIWGIDDMGESYPIKEFFSQRQMEQYLASEVYQAQLNGSYDFWSTELPTLKIYSSSGHIAYFHTQEAYDQYIKEANVEFFDGKGLPSKINPDPDSPGRFYTTPPQFKVYDSKGNLIQACITEDERELYLETKGGSYYTQYPTFALYNRKGDIEIRFVTEEERTAYLKEHRTEAYKLYTTCPSVALYLQDCTQDNSVIYFATEAERDAYEKAYPNQTYYHESPEYALYNSDDKIRYVFKDKAERTLFLDKWKQEHPNEMLYENSLSIVIYDKTDVLHRFRTEEEKEQYIANNSNIAPFRDEPAPFKLYERDSYYRIICTFDTEEEMEAYLKEATEEGRFLYTVKPEHFLYVYKYNSYGGYETYQFASEEERLNYIEKNSSPDNPLYTEPYKVPVYDTKGNVVERFLSTAERDAYIEQNNSGDIPSYYTEKPTVYLYDESGGIVRKFADIAERDKYISNNSSETFYTEKPTVYVYDESGKIVKKFVDTVKRDEYISENPLKILYTEKPTINVYDEDGKIIRKFKDEADRDAYINAEKEKGNVVYTKIPNIFIYNENGDKISKRFESEAAAEAYAQKLGIPFRTDPPVLRITDSNENGSSHTIFWTVNDFKEYVDKNPNWTDTEGRKVEVDGKSIWSSDSKDDYELNNYLNSIPSATATAAVNDITITEVSNNREDSEENEGNTELGYTESTDADMDEADSDEASEEETEVTEETVLDEAATDATEVTDLIADSDTVIDETGEVLDESLAADASEEIEVDENGNPIISDENITETTDDDLENSITVSDSDSEGNTDTVGDTSTDSVNKVPAGNNSDTVDDTDTVTDDTVSDDTANNNTEIDSTITEGDATDSVPEVGNTENTIPETDSTESTPPDETNDNDDDNTPSENDSTDTNETPSEDLSETGTENTDVNA